MFLLPIEIEIVEVSLIFEVYRIGIVELSMQNLALSLCFESIDKVRHVSAENLLYF